MMFIQIVFKIYGVLLIVGNILRIGYKNTSKVKSLITTIYLSYPYTPCPAFDLVYVLLVKNDVATTILRQLLAVFQSFISSMTLSKYPKIY